MADSASELRIPLPVRIDSNNAQEAEDKIRARISDVKDTPVILDASNLNYISSAGLRMMLRLKKLCGELSIVNVGSEAYEIFDMTGFTEILQIEKACRAISVEGCEKIGSGASGAIYRLSRDTVVKVYSEDENQEDIRREREMAKLAFVLGVPTAISYDVVKVGDRYGAVFELLNAQSFSTILANEPERFGWCVNEFASLLKKIHSTAVPNGKLPQARDKVLYWADTLRGAIPDESYDKLVRLIKAVPESDRMLHCDYHTKNIMQQDGEVFLIDMDTLSVGDPIFEFGQIYNSLIGFYEMDREAVKDFQGFDYETSERFYWDTLGAYLGTKNRAKLREVTDKARILGYTRLISRLIRHGLVDTPDGAEEFALWKDELLTLIDRTDKLEFREDELELDAVRGELDELLSFIEERVSPADPDPKTGMHIALAAEEIFVNIADYAYSDGKGRARVRVELDDDKSKVTLTFEDSGVPFDPVKKQDPDITLSAKDRKPGGLGIFITKKLMDEIAYEYRNGRNVLSFSKKL